MEQQKHQQQQGDIVVFPGAGGVGGVGGNNQTHTAHDIHSGRGTISGHTQQIGTTTSTETVPMDDGNQQTKEDNEHNKDNANDKKNSNTNKDITSTNTNTTTTTTTIGGHGTQLQDTNSSSTTANTTTGDGGDGMALTDQAVLDYLKSKGMGSAALELSKLLEERTKDEIKITKEEDLHKKDENHLPNDNSKIDTAVPSDKMDVDVTVDVTADVTAATSALTTAVVGANNDNNSSSETKKSSTIKNEQLAKTRARLEEDEIIHRNQRTLLSKSTGGHYGYDRDSAWPVVQWGVPDATIVVPSSNTTTTTTTTATTATTADNVSSSTTSAADIVGTDTVSGKSSIVEDIGVVEARAYVNAFVSLQLWVLTLPDDDHGNQSLSYSYTNNPLKRAHELLKQHRNRRNKKNTNNNSGNSNNNKNSNDTKKQKTTKATNNDVDNDEDNNVNIEVEVEDEDNDDENDDYEDDDDDALLQSIIEEVRHGVSVSSSSSPLPSSSLLSGQNGTNTYNLPPSAKKELLSVTFALLVYTYCELLEHGMQSTAHSIRDAFKPIYEPFYMIQYRDLYQCTTTEDMMRLNLHNSQHMEVLSNLETILVQIAQCQLRRQELNGQILNDSNTNTNNNNNTSSSSFQQQQQQQKMDERQKETNIQSIEKYDAKIKQLSKKHEKLSQRAVAVFEKMYDVPFLRRARASRWQLTMSTTTYGLLVSFLNTRNTIGHNKESSLLCMSTILQTKCELHVENRPPLPFTPACIFDEQSLSLLTPGPNSSSTSTTSTGGTVMETIKALDLNNIPVSWTAPAPKLLEEKNNTMNNIKLSFPKFHLDEEYDNETDAFIDKERVMFNRALLINGFRRLEALERKFEYECMPLASQKRLLDAGMEIKKAANPFQPTILMATLCSDSYSSLGITATTTTSSSSISTTIPGGTATPILRPKSTSSQRHRSGGGGGGIGIIDHRSSLSTSIGWEESGIGMCCAKLSPPDGRRVAVGCDDAAIRIWSAVDGRFRERGDEPLQVLLGHKNGFPVVDVDWNRDGRTLISCGCDGSVRLWDTMAVGPFGEVTTSLTKKGNTKIDSTTQSPKNRAGISSINDKNAKNKFKIPPPVPPNKAPDMSVPGLRPENYSHTSGTALAVYRGHVPGSPVWSVSFSPAGYYFASAGADATARLWTTDRPQPVRLFVGHTSSNVNCVEWHPNSNYIITGSDDTTVRLWDIQTGRTVRLLNGCPAGINAVQISPSGRYAAASDYSGIVHLWDLGTGKKVTEFRTVIHSSSKTMDKKSRTISSTIANQTSSTTTSSSARNYCLKFSSCGSALATGGGDCCVRIWDVRSDALAEKPIISTPSLSYPTRQTVLMDMYYTRRNLLISVGKFVSAGP